MDSVNPTQEKTQSKTESKSIPIYMRGSAKRFGSLSNRMSAKMLLLCRLCSVIGAAGWTLIIFSLLGWRTQFSGTMDLAGAIIIAMLGVWCQYCLVLHGRACEEEEEAEFNQSQQEAQHGFIPLPKAAHHPRQALVNPLTKIRRSMMDRLRKLHGHAETHLLRFPSSDKLTVAEFLSCVLFSILGYWGGIYLIDFYRRPPRVIEFRDLAGSCIAVTVGVFLALRLIMFIGFKLKNWSKQ